MDWGVSFADGFCGIYSGVFKYSAHALVGWIAPFIFIGNHQLCTISLVWDAQDTGMISKMDKYRSSRERDKLYIEGSESSKHWSTTRCFRLKCLAPSSSSLSDYRQINLTWSMSGGSTQRETWPRCSSKRQMLAANIPYPMANQA